MTRHSVRLRVLRALGLVGLVALVPLPGCTHDLLQVTDPDIIPDVNTPSGALALKNGVIFRLEQVTAGLGGNGPDNLFIYGGLLADEWRSGDTFVQRNDMDQRLFDPTNTFPAGPRGLLNRGQFAAAAAAVADDVTTRFRYNATYSVNAGQNEIWNLNTSIKRYSMGDKEGGNGLPFATATDPRIPRKIGGRVFDSAT